MSASLGLEQLPRRWRRILGDDFPGDVDTMLALRQQHASLLQVVVGMENHAAKQS